VSIVFNKVTGTVSFGMTSRNSKLFHVCLEMDENLIRVLFPGSYPCMKRLYLSLQMKLMVVLTSNNGVGPDDKIILEVSDALDVLISFMKDGNLNSISLLAAETVGNILVNKQVLQVHSVS